MSFDPRTIPGCTLWLEAEDVPAGTPDGADITTLADRVAASSFAPPGSSSSTRPKFKAASSLLIDRPAITFDGQQELYSAATGHTSQPYTIAIVYAPTNLSAYQMICAHGASGNSNGYGIAPRTYTANQLGGLHALFGWAQSGFATVANARLIHTTVGSSNQPIRTYKDGTKSAFTNSIGMYSPSGAAWLGSDGVAGRRFIGHWGTWISWSRILTAAELDTVHKGLADQYLLTVTLSDLSTYTGTNTPYVYPPPLALSLALAAPFASTPDTAVSPPALPVTLTTGPVALLQGAAPAPRLRILTSAGWVSFGSP